MQLGDGFHIPAPLTEGKRFAIVGKSGSGKTNSLLVLGREFISAGWTIAVVDPMNAFRTLRDTGLPVVVAGTRKSADVQIAPENAAALAKFSFQERTSVVIDVSMHEAGMDILEGFLRQLWTLILRQDEDGPFVPYALFIDEAQLYIPQNGKTAISDLILDMGKRGRQLHLSMAVASQRPASIQKDFLTQSNVMIFHALRSVDINPLKDELAMPEREARALMRGFGKGQAVVVGDPDLVNVASLTGDEDYLLAQVRAWSDTGLMQPVLAQQTDAKALDAQTLAALREAMALEPEKQAPVDQRDALIARLTEELHQKQAEIEALQAQLAATAKPILAGALHADALQVDAIHTGQIVTNGGASAYTPERSRPLIAQELGGQPMPEPPKDWRTPRAISPAVGKQQRRFDAMLQTIKGLPILHRSILVFLMEREGQEFASDTLAYSIGVEPSTLQDRPPLALISQGLIRRPPKSGRYSPFRYSCSARSMLKKQFPDLNTDKLFGQLLRVVPQGGM